MKKIGLITLLCIAVLLVCCKKDKNIDKTDLASSFDKTAMLTNIGENIITVGYADLKISVDSLIYYTDLFTTTPSTLALVALQQSFIKAYLAYQHISTFEFGPADTELIRANFNTFPCDTTQINSKITNGDVALGTIADLDAKGFPAIDFLLYGNTANNVHVLAKFTTDTDATNAKNYLTALVNELQSKTDIVNTAWSKTGGNYINTFESNTASNVGSSIGLLVNQINFDFEILKNAKIGIPAGKRSMETPLPKKAEAVYSAKSLQLVLENLKSIENIYFGRDKQNIDGVGFDDYLIHVDAKHGSGTLNDAIKDKITTAKAKLLLVPESLSQSVVNNASLVTDAYNELQQLVVLLKVDMTSALGVSITYQDNDGD
jgi:uncharacterized protein